MTTPSKARQAVYEIDGVDEACIGMWREWTLSRCDKEEQKRTVNFIYSLAIKEFRKACAAANKAGKGAGK